MRRRRAPKPGGNAPLRQIGESPWLVRLRFVCIPLAFAACWWTTYQHVEGRVSFAWLTSIGAQVQSVTASFRSTPSQPRIAAATPPALTARSPAQVVPTPTIVPLTLPAAAPAPAVAATATPEPAAPVLVLVPTAAPPAARETPAALPSATPAGARATATAPALDPNGPHTIYVIKAGDTLYSIGRRYGVPWSTLAAFNHLTPPYKLILGSRLNIPAT